MFSEILTVLEKRFIHLQSELLEMRRLDGENNEKRESFCLLVLPCEICIIFLSFLALSFSLKELP